MNTPVLVLEPNGTPHEIGMELRYDASEYAYGWALWAISGCCHEQMHWNFKNPPTPHCSGCGVEARVAIPPIASYFRVEGKTTQLNAWIESWTGLKYVDVKIA